MDLLKTGLWSVYTIIHELGHVLDNNFPKIKVGHATIFGGGAADKMLKDMGGNPSLCFPRFACTGYNQNQYSISIAGKDPWLVSSSTSVAEDFAETFVNTIVDSSIVPPGRLNWMKNFISNSRKMHNSNNRVDDSWRIDICKN